MPDTPELTRPPSAKQRLPSASGIRQGEPLWDNPFPENDPRHNALAPHFEMMKVFQAHADDYPNLFIPWKAKSAKWGPGFPDVDLTKLVNFPDAGIAKFVASPGADYCVTKSAGDAATLLLPALDSWFNSGRDAWLRIADAKPWQVWFYAIREFWLKAREETRAADADMDEFEKKAKSWGYLPDGHYLISGPCDEPDARRQDGRIKHVFNSCAYFVGVLAARRARELEGSTEPASGDKSMVVQTGEGPGRQPTGRSDEDRARMVPPILDAYVSERFRINGGPRDRSEREKLHEQFCILGVDFAGTVESCLDLLLRVSPNSDGRRIKDLLSALEIELLKAKRKAAEEGKQVIVLYCDALEKRRVDLRNVFAKYGDPAELHATLRVDSLPPQSAESTEPWRAVEEARAGAYSWLEARAAEQLHKAAGVVGQQPAQPEVAAGDPVGAARRRGRRRNQERRGAIHDAITKHGDEWRDHLGEIFKELDSQEVPLGDFQGREIDLGDSQSQKVSSWEDLDLAEGEERAQIVDALRKYLDPGN
jgi:hypothetical protein